MYLIDDLQSRLKNKPVGPTSQKMPGGITASIRKYLRELVGYCAAALRLAQARGGAQ